MDNPVKNQKLSSKKELDNISKAFKEEMLQGAIAMMPFVSMLRSSQKFLTEEEIKELNEKRA